MRRLLAAVAAVALVAGAVLIRRHVDEGGTRASRDGTVRLVCGTDLAPVCRALAAADASIDVTLEDEGVTADRLVVRRGGDPGFDAWLAAGPWAAVVADDRARAGTEGAVLGRPSSTLARSPATIVALKDRAAALTGACGGAVTWACIGRFAGLPWTAAGGSPAWGTLKPGLAPPEGGHGLVVLAQGVASQVGRTDWASNDLEDPPASAWFDQLVGQAKQAAVAGQTPLARFLVVPASFGAVGALESESGPSVARAANRSNVQVIYPEPVATADVTVIPAAGGSAGDVIDRIDRNRLLDALTASGWRVPGHADVVGVGDGPALPPAAGLPSAGALQYLRDRWTQVP